AARLPEPRALADRDRPAVDRDGVPERDLVVAPAVRVPGATREVEHEVELVRPREGADLRAIAAVDAGPVERGVLDLLPAVLPPVDRARLLRDDDERRASIELRGELARRALVEALSERRRREEQDDEERAHRNEPLALMRGSASPTRTGSNCSNEMARNANGRPMGRPKNNRR